MTAHRDLWALWKLVVGRRVTVRSDGGDLALTVTKFEPRLDVRRLAVGQLVDVRLTATDIRWGTTRFDHATALLQDVRLRAGVAPAVIAAPVLLSLDIPGDTLGDLFTASRVVGDIGADGVARISWGRRPEWGSLEVDAELHGSALHLKPRAVRRRRRWSLPRWMPAYRVRLPEFPHGLQLTGVRCEPHVLRLTGTLPEWQLRVPRRAR